MVNGMPKFRVRNARKWLRELGRLFWSKFRSFVKPFVHKFVKAFHFESPQHWIPRSCLRQYEKFFADRKLWPIKNCYSSDWVSTWFCRKWDWNLHSKLMRNDVQKKFSKSFMNICLKCCAHQLRCLISLIRRQNIW